MCNLKVVIGIEIKIGFNSNCAPKTNTGSAAKKAKEATCQTDIIDKLDQGHSILYYFRGWFKFLIDKKKLLAWVKWNRLI